MVQSHNGIFSNVKRNEELTHATIQIKLENMLSERSQARKTTYCEIPLILDLQDRPIHRDHVAVLF